MSNILIVEDDPAVRSQYAAILKKRGYSVQQARDAREGLRALAQTPPRLIILDVLMPGSDGLTFLKAADIPGEYPGAKVLVASNVETPALTEQLEQLGVDRYVLKADYTPYQLADLVRELIG